MSKQVHRYRIVRPIGRDQHGVVYQADALDRWGKIAAQLALVVFSADAAEVVERLRSIQPRLQQARLPGIARMDQIIRFDGHWAGLRQLHDGLSVRAIVELGAVPPHVVAELGARVALSLHQAYGLPGADGTPQRLLHGSVQADAVFVTERGQVLLLGFGAAGIDPSEGVMQEQSDWGWVPPERWGGEHSRAGEIYSLAAVLYQLLVGEPLPRVASSRAQHQAALAQWLERVEPLGQDWTKLLRDMLAWRPDRRPTALEVQRRCGRSVADHMGALRAWASGVLPGLRRRYPALGPDAMCNLVFEASSAADLIEEQDSSVIPWDDVTSSYPLGALRSSFGQRPSEQVTIDPDMTTPDALPLRESRETQPDPTQSAGRNPYFMLFVASLALAVVLLVALGVVLALLGLGFFA